MENAVTPILLFFDLSYYSSSPLLLLALAFQIWMIVDAVRHGEYLWAVLIFFFSFITALLYFFLLKREIARIEANYSFREEKKQMERDQEREVLFINQQLKRQQTWHV